MYMNILIYLSLRIKKNHMLAVKRHKFDLLRDRVCVENVINIESAPSFAKRTLLIFQLKSDCLGRK